VRLEAARAHARNCVAVLCSAAQYCIDVLTMATLPTLPAATAPPAARKLRRALLWGALVALLVVAQSLLVWLTVNHERSRAQEQAEAASMVAADDVRQRASRNLQSLQALMWNDASLPPWHTSAAVLLRERRELLQLERRDIQMRVTEAIDSPYTSGLFQRIGRSDLSLEALTACATAARLASPAYSRSYFVPLMSGSGLEVMDVCMPVQSAGQLEGFMVATIGLGGLLTEALGPELLRGHELSFVEGDGTRLARAGLQRGAGVYVSERVIDLNGVSLQLRLDSAAGGPRLIPNVAVAMVLGLSLALGVVVTLLVRDGRRRARVEAALAESLAFRKAMEDSLVTGLRARDLQGRVTYVNPAFCNMVGFTSQQLMGLVTPPYWPPDLIEEYARRQAARFGSGRSIDEAREGFETTFMKQSGERVSVMIFEAPLVNGAGQHTGWMSAVLDVSDQRRVEEISRQQQERLQATARLATVGEMASLLSHELNQPLAAIASYAAGSLNLMQSGAHDDDTAALLQQATERIAEQAERAGRVIKSVHDFVRRREQSREAVACNLLIDAVLPLVRLQTRKSGARVVVDVALPSPRVVCDRTMVEQVLLNLTRNAVQAMEDHTPIEARELRIEVRQHHARWVTFSVIDCGPGVSAEAAARLFTPFFTTRIEGMGLGLSLCRTVIEQHGGALDFVPRVGGPGTEFRFTLPAEKPSKLPVAIDTNNAATQQVAPEELA
jgi:two-component system, LuxR family, sensor histidine kinase DctS